MQASGHAPGAPGSSATGKRAVSGEGRGARRGADDSVEYGFFFFFLMT